MELEDEIEDHFATHRKNLGYLPRLHCADDNSWMSALVCVRHEQWMLMMKRKKQFNGSTSKRGNLPNRA